MNLKIKALEELIQMEDKRMDELRETDPVKAGERFSYILGLVKALTIIQS